EDCQKFDRCFSSLVHEGGLPSRRRVTSHNVMTSLFAKKSIAELKTEAEGQTLRRSLGVVNLTALGIGSIIGTGIFVLTGTAAANNAGPALVLSMVFAAVAC